MSITSTIEQKLRQTFSPLVHFELENESHSHSGPGSETHFRLVMVSSFFDGVDRVSRQRRVMDLLSEERQKGLHALTMRLMTPAEWEKIKESFEMTSPACHGGSKRIP